MNNLYRDENDINNVIEKLRILSEREAFIIEMLQQLQVTENMSDAINSIITGLGIICEADSVSIFESTPDLKSTNKTYEWCFDETKKTMIKNQTITSEQFPNMCKTLVTQKYIHINGYEEMTPELKQIIPLRENTAIAVIFECMEYRGHNIGFLNINRNGEKWNTDDIDFVRNVTGILASAIIRKRIEDQYSETAIKFKTIVQLLSDIVLITDTTGKINFVSPAVSKVVGYKPEELINRNAFEFLYYEDIEYAKEELANVLKKSLNEDELPNTVMLRIINKNGDIISVEGMSHNALDIKGVNGIVMSFKDVSKFKEIENRLLSAKNKAERSDEMKLAFLANMSHEIRTPMNGIVGFASFIQKELSLLKHQANASSKIERYIKIILSNSKILLQLLDDIIDISKMESGQLKMSPRECNINQLLNEEFAMYQGVLKNIGNEKVELILDDNGFDETIIVDPIRLLQVITNLLGNAVKFTEKGFIQYGYEKIGDTHLQFYVKDSGIGIPEEYLPIIFERFRQVDEHHTNKSKGTGIGLSISKNLVEMMGGKIWVESKPGEGSSFYFTVSLLKPTNSTS